MKWKLVLFENKVKAHYVPQDLYQNIVDEIFTRFMVKPFIVYDKDEAVFDVGGAVMIDEPYLSWLTPPKDLKISLLSSHFEYAYDALFSAPLREVNGKPYHKIHGYWHCIVMTPEQKDHLMKVWLEGYQIFKEKALLSNLEFEKRMAEINKDKQIIIHKSRVNIPKDKH